MTAIPVQAPTIKAVFQPSHLVRIMETRSPATTAGMGPGPFRASPMVTFSPFSP
ncbi:MAG TPA: hypothetical protein PKG55_12160 [Acidobacteriota bacterium]|nr:hypothetical protein [Acidobacteriota bacterium]